MLIYHTHTYEAYTATEAYPYTSKEKWRTSSPDRNVVAVGSYLTKLLTDAGVSVTHDTTPYEPPKLSTAYQRSLEMLQKRQQNGESYDLYIDLHRDAYSKGNGPKHRRYAQRRVGAAADAYRQGHRADWRGL